MLASALRSLVGGFLMGTADLIPGVSGGTIALILGIYPRLVASIREASSGLGRLFRLDMPGLRRHLAAVEWTLVVPLLVGIAIAIASLASFLEAQLEARPTILAAAFFGLVAGSVAIAWGLIRRPGPAHLLMVLGAGAVLFVLLGASASEIAGTPGPLVFFGAGALAVCAMILPGISGSLILVLVGMYAAALAAVTSRDWASVAALALGAVVGLALFSQALHWALRRHHDLVVAAMVGLMVGSLRILWPWPAGVESAALDAPGPDWLGALLAAVVGGLAVKVITRLAGEEPRRR